MSNLQQHKQDPDLSPPTVVSMKRNINYLMEGRINSTGTVTLTKNGTSTVLYDNHANPLTNYFFTPITANAATVTGLWFDPTSITIPVQGASGGTVTLHHSAVNASDLEFSYCAFT